MRSSNDIPLVSWSFDSQPIDIPIIDVSHPRFALPHDATFQKKLYSDYEAEEQRQAKTPPFLTALMSRLGARQSRLLHPLVYPKENFLGGLSTYLMKLGANNLPAGFNRRVDRAVASSPHTISMRIRLQQCAELLAESLKEPLRLSPTAPLCLLNIAGGTGIDSINALILLQREAPELLKRRVTLTVLDIDTFGPAFGAKAAKVLCKDGRPLSGLDLHFKHQPYDWNDTGCLADTVQQFAADGAIIAASSEGGLFEYADDSIVVANLKALWYEGVGAQRVVGSVTSSDPVRRASIKRAKFRLMPRNIESFARLAKESGYDLTKQKDTPLSYQVLLQTSNP